MINLSQHYKSVINSILLLIIGIVMAFAGISKLFPLQEFISQMMRYDFPFPKILQQAGSIPLIVLEIWTGLSIIFRSHLRLALISSFLLLLFFIPISLWGIYHQVPTCACYGGIIHRSPLHTLIEDIILISINAYLYIQYRHYQDTFTFRHILQGSIIAIAIAFGALGTTQLCSTGIITLP